MSKATLHGVRVMGVSAAVPETARTLEDDACLFDIGDLEKISASTGVSGRHVGQALTTSDLCLAAAEALFSGCDCDRRSVDALIFISQTPDYPLPATSCCLQARLGLSTRCAAFDISLGCSGYVYGLWLASCLIQSGAAGRVLLLVGDTIYRTCSTEDRSTCFLFGDAGSATLLERDVDAPPVHFVVGTDGSGAEHLKIPAGGFRQRFSSEAMLRQEFEAGNRRSALELYMNGAEVFAFTLRAVPALVKELFAQSKSSVTEIDYFVFHQANRFMLEHLFKRLRLPPEKCPIGLKNYGNTSSASIPLALVTELRDRLQAAPCQLLLAGFGVGFSWAGAVMNFSNVQVPELVLVPEPFRPAEM